MLISFTKKHRSKRIFCGQFQSYKKSVYQFQFKVFLFEKKNSKPKQIQKNDNLCFPQKLSKTEFFYKGINE